MVCGECGRVIENNEIVEAEHPTAKWIYTCHRACWTGRFPWETRPINKID